MPFELSTPDSIKYNYYPIPSSPLRFRVKAAHDAHIVLCEKSNPGHNDPVIEVVIGAGINTYSCIRRNWNERSVDPYLGACPDMASLKTLDICSEKEFRGFWINYLGGAIAVGRENETKPFLSWTDPKPINVSHFGVHTGWGATGVWILNAPNDMKRKAVWVPGPADQMPLNSVVGGYDGQMLYVGRAWHNEGVLVPGKIVRSEEGKMVCSVTWDGIEYKKSVFEILVGCNLKWEASSGDHIPHGAIAGGCDSSETIYIGRVKHKDLNIVGKIHPSHKVCYISQGGKELAFPEYEILVHL